MMKQKLQQISFLWRLAWRFTSDNTRAGVWRWISYASMVSIFITATALMLSYGVITGLHNATAQALQFLQPDIEITTPLTRDQKVLLNSAQNKLGIATLCTQSTTPALVHAHRRRDCAHSALLLGIDVTCDPRIKQLAQRIDTPVSAQDLQATTVLVGKTLAHSLRITTGDEVVLQWQMEDEKSDQRIVEVVGILDTGLDEWDQHAIIASNELIDDLMATQTQRTTALFVHDATHVNTVTTSIRKLLPTTTLLTWQDKYPALVSALWLERVGLGILLGIVCLLAFLHLAAVVVLTIQRKLSQAALLYIHGTTRSNLILLFSFVGMQYALSASLPGILLAKIISMLVTHWQLIALPDVYYVGYLPVVISIESMLFCITMYMLLGFAAAIATFSGIKAQALLQALRS